MRGTSGAIRVVARVIGAAVLAACAAAPGCSQKPTLILSEPTGAFVTVDKVAVGRAPVTYTFDFGARPMSVVEAKLDGYYESTTTITRDTPGVRDGKLTLALQNNDAWLATTTSEATNKWLRIEVNSAIERQKMWAQIMDAVTNRYSSIEGVEPTSLYLRSVPLARTFTNARQGQFEVRTQFFVSIAQQDPLVLKMKIQSESSDREGVWRPYERVFKEDAQLVEELQSRLGIK